MVGVRAFTRTNQEAAVTHIVNTLQKHLTGSVGPVRFVNGHADSNDPELLEFFRSQPDRYEVEDDEPPTDAVELHDLADAADLIPKDTDHQE